LRELALRKVAEEVGAKAAQYRKREGFGTCADPEKVLVCISSNQTAKKLLARRFTHRRTFGQRMVCRFL